MALYLPITYFFFQSCILLYRAVKPRLNAVP